MIRTSPHRAVALIVILQLILCACGAPTAPPPPTQAPVVQPPQPTPTSVPPSPTDTPTASATLQPTDTPMPADARLPSLPSEPTTLGILYKKTGVLHYWLNSIDTLLAEASSEVACSLQVQISSDGQVIAYVDNNVLYAIDAGKVEPRLLFAPMALSSGQQPEPGQQVGIMHVKWIPGTHRLLLNTLNILGPGAAQPRDDLHLINADTGSHKVLLEPGEGGSFFPSPDGKNIAVATQERIILMNSDGSSQRTVLEFAPVLTLDQYGYYPTPTWAPDSASLSVAIPPENPYSSPRTPTALWHIPMHGEDPNQNSSLDQGVGVYPVYFSNDPSQIAYISDLATYPQIELNTAMADGSQAAVYATGANLSFVGWLPASDYFIYNWNLLGAAGQEPQSLTMLTSTVNRWPGLLIYSWSDPAYWLITQNVPWVPDMHMITALPALETSPNNADEVCDYRVLPLSSVPTSTPTPTGHTPTPTQTLTPAPTETPVLTPTLALTATLQLTVTATLTPTPTINPGDAALVLSEHAERVNGVSFSPDGRSLASASSDRTIKLWDLKAGDLEDTFKGHEGPVTAVQFSPDGGLLASAGGSGDRSIRLWVPSFGRATLTIIGHNDAIRTLAFNSSGSLLASAGDEGDVLLWDVASGIINKTFRGHSGPVSSVAFFPNAQLLLSGGSDGLVHIWDINTGEIIDTMPGDGAAVNAVAIGPAGYLVAIGYADGTVGLWDISRRALLNTLEISQAAVNALVISPDGRWLAWGGDDQVIYLYDLAADEFIDTLKGHTGSIRGLAFSPFGDTLASASSDTSVRLWEVPQP